MSRARLLTLLVLAAFGLRAAWVLVLGDRIVIGDEPRYWEEIRSVAAGEGFKAWAERAHDMPMTGVVLGLLERWFGWGVPGARMVLAAVSSLLVVPVALLAQELAPGRRSLLLAGAVTAVYPFFVFYAGLVLSESFFLLFTTTFFWLLLAGGRGAQGWGRSAGQGAAVGLAHLARPTLMYFLPVAWGWSLLRGRPWARVLLAVACFCLAVAPWVVRNYQVYGEFMPGTAGTGQVLWEGNNPDNRTGGVSEPHWTYLDDMPEGLNDLEQDQWKMQRAKEYIRDNPGRFLVLAGKKFLRFWNLWPNAESYRNPLHMAVSALSFGPVLLLALASLRTLRHRFADTAVLWIFFCYYTAMHMVTIGSLRYRLPLEPLLIALAAAGLSAWLQRRKEASRA